MKTTSLFMLTLFLSCSRIVEPVSFGEYFVTNSTDKTIILEAISIGGSEATLLANFISAGEKAHIYSVAEGSGGHVRPSNYFSSFTVYADSIAEANIIYSKVEDSDWIDEGNDGQGHSMYHLTIE
jgi:hypothetical protein